MTTTASSMPFAVMEAGSLDDTMEMASPYQGQVDDFEIDLDAMEDQVSNPDRDMTVADDEPHASNMDFNQYAANDTDMVDDVAEGAMVDADDQDPVAADQRYGGQEVYEADMAEDDYDEDIDAPIPNIEAEDVPVTLEDGSYQVPREQAQPVDRNGLVEESRHESVVEQAVETWEDNADEHHPGSQNATEQRDDHVPGAVPEETQPPQITPKHADDGLQETNGTERVDPQTLHPDGGEANHAGTQHAEHGEAADETQPSVSEPKNQHVQEVENKKVLESNDQETDVSHEAAPLHPLKVYYQENEISLFPPREGDPSEMFLLEDESLAYGDFGELLDSCREVLKKSIGENEVLVMDVESLNIQLTEESPYLSQVTLHQMVDLYLRLCHNEDVAEPEPLYLTLSTKLTIPAQISDLTESVNQGKGLSDIQSWHDDDGTVPVSAEDHARQSDHELDHVAPDQDTTSPNDLREVSKEAAPSLHAQDTQDESVEQEREGDGKQPGDGEGTALAPDIAEAECVDYEGEYPVASVPGVTHREASYHSSNEGTYDSEAQKSESTTTIAQQFPDEQYHEPVSVPLDEQAAHDIYGEHHDAEATDAQYDDTGDVAQGEYDDTEEVADGEYENTEDVAPLDDPHTAEDAWDEDYDGSQGETGEVDVSTTERLEGDAHETDGNTDSVEDANHQVGENWSDDAAEDDGHFVEGFDADSGAVHGDSETKEGSARQDESHIATRDSQELTDDLLGFSEDVDALTEGMVHTNGQAADKPELGEVRDITEDALRDLPGHDEDFGLDDEEHVDLGAGNALEANAAGSPHAEPHAYDNTSTKRTREPEGESEPGETKRRRSS